MALMVRDSYHPKDRTIFREGMGKIDDATQKAYKTTFMKATPEQRLAVLTDIDKERKAIDDARNEARKKRTLANLTDQKQANAQGAQTLFPPSDLENVGRFATLKDPQGAAFALFQPEAA